MITQTFCPQALSRPGTGGAPQQSIVSLLREEQRFKPRKQRLTDLSEQKY